MIKMLDCDVQSGLKWYVYVTACVIGYSMAIRKIHKGMKAYSDCGFLASIYFFFALWFVSGPVVSTICLSMHHNENCEEPVEDQCEVRMRRFIYIYSILASVMIFFMLMWMFPSYWYDGMMCRCGLLVCIAATLTWTGCTGALLDTDPVLCNA